jgi:hypothetical protein
MRPKYIENEIANTLKARWAYNPSTGVITWKTGRRAGLEVSRFANKNGLERTQLKLNGKNQTFTYARVCWFLHYGEDLPDFIDHIDGDCTNHRIENLRPCSKSTNGMNRFGVEKRKHALPKNVYIHKGGPRYRVSVRVNYKTVSGGVYDTVAEAEAAANALRIKCHRSFAHG